jgi:hypothetical protein
MIHSCSYQSRKMQTLRLALSRRRFIAALGGLTFFPDLAAGAEPTRRRHLIVDETTGLAIGGYDPIAYFIEGQPRRGLPEFQTDWRGATWLFLNEGNLGAFVERPDVYTPIFGGYCAFAVAQGRPAEGNPLHFAVIGGRLYLFANAASRLAFLEAGATIVAEATRRWPEVSRDLP